ncbi:MAG: GNAT family N-acetyltransferase [Actinomycetota bacterium]
MTIEVREARPDEYAEAGAVTARAYREFLRPDSDWADYLEEIADIGERATRTTILVAVEGHKILGSLTLELEGRVSVELGRDRLEPGESHVRMLGVDPDARRQGVARLLMADAQARALAAGKSRMTLHTAPTMIAAQRFYERLGFGRGADDVFPDGFTLLSYAKELV